MQVIRLVGVIRQSRFKGEQAVSEESQRQAIERFTEARNRVLESQGQKLVITGWAIDIGVSADKYDPWNRPQLGEWLKKPEAWDGMISFKLDRIARNTLDFAKLMQYWDENGKTFLCSDDPIDLTNDLGRAVAVILSVLAELELKNIKARAKNARNTLNEAGRYTGGHVPFGRKAVLVDGQWKLIIDPDAAKTFKRILDLFYEGKAFSEIAEILNAEGARTGRGNQDSQRQREDRGYQWVGGVISRLLRERHLIGHREINGVVLRDDKGEPVLYCDPLMKVSEWSRLQKKLDERQGKDRAQANTSLGRKVGGCLVCGEYLHSIDNTPRDEKDRRHRPPRYRCASIAQKGSGKIAKACGNSTIQAHIWESHLENAILDMAGHYPRMEKVYMPGEDHAEELERVDDSIWRLQEESDRGLIRDRELYFSRLERLQAQRDRLLELPQRPAGWRDEPTGETVAEYWSSMDTAQRNLWLQEMGVRLFYSNKDGVTKWRMVWGDLEKLPLLAQGIDEEQAAPVDES